MSGSIERLNLTSQTLIIPAGQQTSNGLRIGGVAIGQLLFPSGMLSTTIKYEVSVDDVTYYRLQDGAGSDIQSTMAAGKAIATPQDLAGAAWFRIVAGTTESGGATVAVSMKT